MPKSKAHLLRRFLKIGRKVIEYSYISGQCRQTINKHFELQAIVDIHDPDVIGITKTLAWLNSKLLDNENCIEDSSRQSRHKGW